MEATIPLGTQQLNFDACYTKVKTAFVAFEAKYTLYCAHNQERVTAYCKATNVVTSSGSDLVPGTEMYTLNAKADGQWTRRETFMTGGAANVKVHGIWKRTDKVPSVTQRFHFDGQHEYVRVVGRLWALGAWNVGEVRTETVQRLNRDETVMKQG